MEKLYDLLGTKYITVDHVGKLKDVLKSVKEVDIAKCKFVPSAEIVLREFYDKVYMVNSENKRLNTILLHNMTAKNIQPRVSVPVPVHMKNADEVVEVFKTIDRNQMYNLESYKDAPRKCLAMVTALTLKFPEITFDLGIYARDLFDFARVELLQSCPGSHSQYWMVDGKAVIDLGVAGGKVVMPDGTVIPERQLVELHTVLPYEFGTKQLTNDREFNALWMNCLKMLSTQTAEGTHMYDFIRSK